jgi:hypothetical protein
MCNETVLFGGVTVTKPIASLPRVDQLRELAYTRGLTNEDAKPFGKLSKTATWETLLLMHLTEGESLDTVLDSYLA